jgi:hypothetical protein
VLEDARALKGVYGQEVPELNRARPVNVTLSSPGGVPQVRCGLTLRTFPQYPPKKYFGDNAIYVELTFDGVDEVRLRGHLSAGRAHIRLWRDEDGIEFELFNSTLSIELSCEVVSLSRITSYIDDNVGPVV